MGCTGIELGADSCVLVRVRSGADDIRLSAVSGTSAPDWDAARPFVDNLRRARRAGRFPRHAKVVAWDLHESASPSAALPRALLAPLRDAGFVVDAVLSPPDALCALAERRPRTAERGSEAWLALNRQGVAMAIVEDGRLLYRRTFDWHYRPAATQREELLQRYSLVAHLAPELRHGIDVVRAEHGATVRTIVTCGDLPDLRSLTMPLIEEMDLEVETLDTLEGIHTEGAAAGDAVAEQAPALRLACAAAAAGSTPGRAVPSRLLAAAAVLLVILSGAWVMRSLRGPRATVSVRDQSGPPAPVPRTPSKPPASSPPRDTAPPVPGPPPESTAATMGRAPSRPESVSPTDSRAAVPLARESAKPRAYEGSRAAAADAIPRRTPLPVPLPKVNSILVEPERRLAVLDGQIVREGEAIGPRVLVRIDPGSVVLREPSGYEVRVPIRRKPI